MVSLKTAFGSAASGNSRVSVFALILLILAIDDDRQRREEEKRKKRERDASVPRKPKPPAGPRPF